MARRVTIHSSNSGALFVLIALTIAGCHVISGLGDVDEIEAASSSSSASGNATVSSSGVGGRGATANSSSVGVGGSGAVSSATATSSSISGVGGAGQGGGGAQGVCGDGVVENGEVCDDGNSMMDDGCANCQVEPGWECDTSMPTICTEIQPVVETDTQGGPADDIIDNGYDGNLSSMNCIDLNVTSIYLNTVHVTVEVGINHNWVGDLVIKVQHPSSLVTTLMSIPGAVEQTDDGLVPEGDSSDLVASHPILFADDAVDDAEQMGMGLGDTIEICKDAGPCEYHPNSGAGPGNGLADFNGLDPNGIWRVCVGDAYPNYAGTFKEATISILAW